MSSATAGTEVQLTVPAHIAFKDEAAAKPSWFSNLFRPRSRTEETRK
jgi:hypothetical protein